MRSPEFDRRVWTLVTSNSKYALLRSVVNETVGMVAVFADGDWEHHDRGEYMAMARAYQILTQAAQEYQTLSAALKDNDLDDQAFEVSEPSGGYAANPNYGRF